MCNLYLTLYFVDSWHEDFCGFIWMRDVYVQDFGRPGTDKIQMDHLFGKTFPKKMPLEAPRDMLVHLFLKHHTQENPVVERSPGHTIGGWRAVWPSRPGDVLPGPIDVCAVLCLLKRHGTQLETDWSLTFPYCWWKKSG